MHISSFKMWISGGSIAFFIQILTLVIAQGDSEFKHELPPGVELVNPKDFGLTDDQLGGLLSNVKVLGGSQIGDSKTQILTVGFEGDENINFDDFDIPGLTDRKPADIPDKDKEIASVAFEKFKEFFKDPKKSAQTYKPQQPEARETEPEVKVNFTPELKNTRKNPQRQQQQQQTNPSPNHHRQYHERVRPSQESLQQHYPVQLTQPGPSLSTSPTVVPPQQNPQQFNENLHNHRTNHHNTPPPTSSNSYNPQYHSSGMLPPPPLRHSSHAIAFTNNNQPSTPSNYDQEFGSKVPTRQPQQQGNNNIKLYNNNNNNAPPLNQVSHQQQQQQHEEKVQVHHQQQHNSLPPGNFQRFTIFPHQQQQQQQNPSAPPTQPPRSRTTPQQQREHKQREQVVGQVVRNQLLFTNNNNNQQNAYESAPPQSNHHQQLQYSEQSHQEVVVPPHQDPTEYRTITHNRFPQPPPLAPPSFQNPSPSSSSSVPSLLSRFPANDPQKRPVSHVFIQQGNQGNPPVQQTSFHPRFQPPTRFVNDFTPSINHITTPAPGPHFEVTPSMPMILISTNENAITDPQRMELLRKQQRAMEQKRLRHLQQIELTKERQPHSLNNNNNNNNNNYNNNKQQSHSPVNNNHITESPKHNYSPQNTFTQTQYRQLYNNKIVHNDDRNNQQQNNAFNFQTQQQQHQLHTLQQQQYFNTQTQQLPPRQYYQQQQELVQPQSSTNYASIPINIGIQPPPPPRGRPDHLQFYGGRHKRGYRHRLSSILRGLWGDRDY